MKEKFLEILRQCKREGIEDLINWLETTDFFEAPASSKFHLCCKQGLVKHSLNVYYNLQMLKEMYVNNINKDSIIICGLLHDLCKANFYKIEMRNVKENGSWIQKPYYAIDEQFPIGHGEKSVILLQKFIKLTDDEIMAIRWHMSGYDNAVKGGDYSIASANNKCCLLTLLQCADIISSQIIENKEV